MIAAGQQRCAGRRAERGRVEIRVAEAGRGELVEIGRFDQPAIGAELAVADVVEHDHQDVWRAGWRLHRHDRIPVGRRVLVGLTDFARENWHRQYGPVLRSGKRRKGTTEGRHDDCCSKQHGSSPPAHESLLPTSVVFSIQARNRVTPARPQRLLSCQTFFIGPALAASTKRARVTTRARC